MVKININEIEYPIQPKRLKLTKPYVGQTQYIFPDSLSIVSHLRDTNILLTYKCF